MTQSGFLVGTPGYMAPEQASGKRALVGPATDIHALGVILYQLLTGQLPFQRDSTLELLRAVTVDEPTRPRRLQPGLPRDLEAITLHCLEKEPSRRYPSALALAEDLERFREGKPVMARPVGALARLARACRRRPLVTLLARPSGRLPFGWAGWRDLEMAGSERTTGPGERPRRSAGVTPRNRRRCTRPTGPPWPPPARRWRTTTWPTLTATSRQRRRLCWVGNGGTCAAGSMTALRWCRCLPGKDASLIDGPDRLRIGILTGAGLRITDLDGGEPGIVPIGPERSAIMSASPRPAAAFGSRRGSMKRPLTCSTSRGQVLCRVVRPDGRERDAASRRESRRHTAGVSRLAAEGSISVFDATSGRLTAICNGHAAGVMDLRLQPGQHAAGLGQRRSDGACVGRGHRHAAGHLPRARE